MKRLAKLKDYFSLCMKIAAIFVAAILFADNLFAEEYIWSEKANSATQGVFDWDSLGTTNAGNVSGYSIWKQHNVNVWTYLTFVPAMTASDTILFSGEVTASVKLTSNITVGKIILGFQMAGATGVGSGEYPITIDLNGYNLTCTELELNNLEGGVGNYRVNVSFINSSATPSNVTITTLDYSDNKNHNLTIGNNVTVKATNYSPKAVGSDGGLSIKSEGNAVINLPAEALADIDFEDVIWTGATSTDWNDPANWKSPSSSGIGSITQVQNAKTVTIPNGRSRYPVLASAVELNTLIIENDATVTGGTNSIKVTKLESKGKILSASTLTVDETAEIGGNITTSGKQTYTGAVTITDDSLFTAGDTGVLFSSTIDGGDFDLSFGDAANKTKCVFSDEVTNVKNLYISGDYSGLGGKISPISCSGSIKIDGAVEIRGNISADSLVIGGVTSLCGACDSVTTVNEQKYGANVQLLKADAASPVQLISTAGKDVEITGTLMKWYDGWEDTASVIIGSVANPTNLSVNKISTSSTNPVRNVTVNGNLKCSETIYAASISVSGTSSLGGNVTTTGNQTYTGAVTLTNNITLVAPAASKVTFGSKINSDGTNRDLTIGNGTNEPAVEIKGAVGDTAKLKNLTVLNNLVMNTGAINCTEMLFVGGNVIFRGAVSADSIEIKGTTTVGNVTGKITTTGNQIYHDVVEINSQNSSTNATFIAGTEVSPGTVQFKKAVQKYASATDDPNFIIGSATIKSNVELAASFEGFNNITVYGDSTLAAAVTKISSSGAQEYEGAITFASDVEFVTSNTNDITFGSRLTPGFDISVETNQGNVSFADANTFNNLTITGASQVSLGSGNTFTNLKITDASEVTLGGDNTFTDLSIQNTTASSSVKFDGGSFQKITGKLTLEGKDEDNRLTFGDTTASEWFIYLGNKDNSSFTYVTVANSTSKNVNNSAGVELELAPTKATIIDTVLVSSKGWFIHKYYWLGNIDSNWSTGYNQVTAKGNWFYDENGLIPSPVPNYNDGTSDIVVKKQTNDLNLDEQTFTPNTLSLKSLTIESDNRFALSGFSLNVTDLTNNGTFALKGVASQSVSVSGTMTHDADSTIEYYGTDVASDIFCVSTTTDASGSVNNYKNLLITKTGGTFDFNNPLTAKTFIVDENAKLSTTSSLVLAADSMTVKEKGEFTTTSTVTITAYFENQGTFTLSSGDSIFVSKDAKNYGTFTASSDKTTFGATFFNNGTFNHNNGTVEFKGLIETTNIAFYNVIIAGDGRTPSSFSVEGYAWDNQGTFNATAGTITFANSTATGLTISGNNAFYNVGITLSPLVTISGANTYHDLSITKSGATVSFGAGKTQKINGKFVVTGTAGNEITLTTDATTPSLPSSGNSDSSWWKLDGIPAFSTWASGSEPMDLQYVKVEYAISANNLAHDWGKDASGNLYVKENVEASTYKWFITTFYWIGRTDTNWETPSNWSSDENGSDTLSTFPPYSMGTSSVVIAGNNVVILKLDKSDYRLKNLTVNQNKIVDFGTSNVSISNGGKLTNNGRIRIHGKADGSQTIYVQNPVTDLIQNNTSVIEYYGDLGSTLPWGQTYQKLEFTNGAKGNITTAITVNGTTSIENGTGNNIILDNSSNTFTGIVTVQNAGGVVLNSASSIKLTDTVSCDSLEIKCPFTGSDLDITLSTGTLTAGSTIAASSIKVTGSSSLGGNVTTTGSQTYNGDVTLTVGSTITASSIKVTGSSSLGGNVTTTGRQTYNGEVTYLEDITMEGSVINFAQGVKTTLAKALTLNAVTYLTGKGNFGGTVTDSSITVKGNLFVGLLSDDLTFGLGITAEKDMYISNTESKNLIISNPLSVTGNFALFNGTVNLNSNLTVGNDLVLLNGNQFTDNIATDGPSGKDIFVYNLSDRPKAVSLTSFPTKVIADNDFNSQTYNSKLNPSAGVTIQVGQNFFDNGVNLNSTGIWYLKLKDNTNATSAFAELYNAEISYCKVIVNGTGTAYLAAAEGEDKGNNSNVYFSRPLIGSAFTVYDDVIKIEFTDSITGNPIKIENSNNEISTEFTNRVWYLNNGSPVKFAGTYTDAECTVSTDGKGDLSEFYIKAGNTWKTDATGISSGASESTNRKGENANAVPLVNLPKANSASYFGLRDEHKNRVANYYNATVPNTSNSTPGNTYTAVTDGCAPVLIKVTTGREKHVTPSGNAATPATEAQQPQDAHNYIEFVYSEAVNISDGGSINMLYDSGDLNIGASSSLGETTNAGSDENAGITINGFVKIQKGFILANTSVPGNPINSMYRKYSVNNNPAAVQTHGVRVAIAGYVDGTISADGKTYFNWTSYIDSAHLPTGDITRLPNDNITDTAGNKLAYSGAANHDLVQITLSPLSQGKWDVTPPSFVPLRLNGSQWNSSLMSQDQYEAVGAAYSGHTYLDAIEIHMFDDEPDWSSSNQWFSKIGWADTTDNLTYSSVTAYAADQRGGIRYSTLYNLSSSFTYKKVGTATVLPFDTVSIKGGAESSLFRSSESSNSTGAEDGCYFKIYFPIGLNYDPRSTFSVSFNPSATTVLTDLAGNRIKTGISYSIPTIDRTPPALNMTVAPCGKDEIYVVFSKFLATEELTVYSDATHSVTLNPLDYIPKSIEVSDNAGNPIQIDTSIPARVVHKTEHATGFILKLDRAVDWADISGGLTIKIKATDIASHSFDALSGITGRITYIQDMIGNSADADSKHAFTDFAVNVLDVEYGYNIGMNNTTDQEIQFGLYSQDSWAVHDWSRNQTNFGVLNPNYDVLIRAKFYDGTLNNSAGADSVSGLKIYYDNTVAANSISTEYNRFSGRDLRIWLPQVFSNLAPVANPADWQAGVPLAEDENPYHFDFTLPVSDPEYKAGDQVTFLFDTGVTVNHFATGNASDDQPLYALRLEDENDITSLDLWSFKLKEISEQRGGVSILNNVINPVEGEKTVIRTNFATEKNINIIVMTLDGNIVTYLNRGTVASGEQFFTWDGFNAKGSMVARGIYFVRFVGDGVDETRKVMVVK